MKKILLLIIILSALLSSCSAPEAIFKDDALRIRHDRHETYEFLAITDGTDTLDMIPRNGYTLRGTVIKIQKITYPVNCENPDSVETRYYVQFRDSNAKEEDYFELIPLEDVRLIGPDLEIEKNDYGNINYFESFNNPLDPLSVREVPVDSTHIDTCSVSCNCRPLSGPPLPHISINLRCPDCDYKNYFVELRASYMAYNDFQNKNGLKLTQEAWSGEIAAGYRFNSNWGLGLAYNSGVPVYNTFTETSFNRPSLMLHGRYSFNKWNCMLPFLYGQFGMAIDDFSLDLGRVSWCDDCNDDIEIEPPGTDISIPLSYGIGAGLDIPLPYCFFDLSFDIGYRSLAIGENVSTFQFLNVPSKRRIHMLVFRMGVTLGY